MNLEASSLGDLTLSTEVMYSNRTNKLVIKSGILRTLTIFINININLFKKFRILFRKFE
jgi:hypothetical protein